MRLRLARLAVAATTWVLCSSIDAPAQPLAELLPDLILREIVLTSPPLTEVSFGFPVGFTHEAHFSPIEAGELNNPVVGIVQSFNSGVV